MKKNLKEMISEILEEKARLNMIKFFKKHHAEQHAHFYENIYQILERELRERVFSSRMNSDTRVDFSLMGEGMAEVKFTYEIIQELYDELKNEQGHAVYSGEWIEPSYQNQYIIGVQKRITNTDWKLQVCKTYGDIWSWEKGRRIYKQHDVARLINSNQSELIFDIPEEMYPDDDPEPIHVLMYSQTPVNQRGFYHMKKTFLDAVKIIAFDAGYRGIMSPCLYNTKGVPDVKIKKGEGNDWRTIKRGQDRWKLMQMWLMLGFIRPKFTGTNPDEIYLFSPKFALEVKKTFIKQGYENPYKDLKRCSIYEDGVREELKR